MWKGASSFSLDPLNGRTFGTWYTRNKPMVSWSATGRRNGQATSDPTGTKYTVIMLDVYYGFPHAIYTNIAGTNWVNGDVSLALNSFMLTKYIQ